jgi:hypothetical protein
LGVLAHRELSSIIQLSSVLISRLQTKRKKKDREPPDECGGMPYALSHLINWKIWQVNWKI